MDHLLSKELYLLGCSCILWLVEYASVMLPTVVYVKSGWNIHLKRQTQVFEWRFVIHVCRAQFLKVIVVCMLVHCWVSGALFPFFVPDHFVC